MNISTPGLVIITASQGSGKSHLMKYIISQHKQKLKYGIAFSHTAFNEGNLSYIPKKYIFAQYQPDKLQNLMKIQESLPQGKRPLAFVILDDCLFDSWVNCKHFNRLMTQLRHYNILVIITTQYVNKISTMIRENAFQVCIFASDTERSLKSLYESYGQKFEKFSDFKDYIMKNTGDYKFIFYNRNEMDKDKQYQILKAPAKLPNFRLKY
jgi:hypothetical protein